MHREGATVFQVVPAGTGGVRDHACGLRAAWSRLGVDSGLIALSKEPSRVHALADLVDEALPAREAPCAVVVHYSGYGYAPRGLCFWLVDELKALRARHGERLRLIVLFHELHASGPPWRSAFWLAPLQAAIAKQLAGMADAVWTNAEHHATWLRRRIGAGAPVHVRPVFSNVGEPDRLPPFAERLPDAVVFGSASTRQRAFDALRRHEPTLHRLGIRAVVEIGTGAASTGLLATLPRRHLGRLEPEALGRVLLQSRFGLFDYPSHALGKSGVLAAYAAHGCVALDTRSHGADADGLIAGRDYLSMDRLIRHDGDLDPARVAATAVALSNWYAGHRLTQQAKEMLALAVA